MRRSRHAWSEDACRLCGARRRKMKGGMHWLQASGKWTQEPVVCVQGDLLLGAPREPLERVEAPKAPASVATVVCDVKPLREGASPEEWVIYLRQMFPRSSGKVLECASDS